MSEFLRKFSPLIVMIGMAGSLYWLRTLENNQVQENSFEGQTMGTTYHVTYKVFPEDGIDFRSLEDAIEDEVALTLIEVNRQMSTYKEDSEISQINHLDDISKSVNISEDFAKVLEASRKVHQMTDKAFDITVGPLVNLWGFGPKGIRKEPPSAEAIAKARALVGMDKWQVTQSDNQYRIQKTQKGVYLDLSGIAKGFGVDKIAKLLESKGVHNYLVDIGGELRVKGQWNVAVEAPDPKTLKKVDKILTLKDTSIATSGTYRNFFKNKGKTFSHEIKPQTGEAATGRILSISVLAEDCMMADGLATGFIVLGLDKTLKAVEEQKIPVYILATDANNTEIKVYTSSAFDQMMGK
ncbi:MAG: FAD:protein FMN transferase [Alcaligenaceae bacterium]|nr:FAD:protein FMN transferase [Alcaligenaceae bacterium]